VIVVPPAFWFLCGFVVGWFVHIFRSQWPKFLEMIDDGGDSNDS